MEKKYVGILYKFYGDNNLMGEIVIRDDFESIKKWFKIWTQGSGHEDDFSEENTSIDISWENNNFDEHRLCVVDDWNDDKQISKLRKVLKKWSRMAGESWQERDWDITDRLSFKVFNKDGILYDIYEDDDFIHSEDGEYEHDLYSDRESDIENYLFEKIDGLVKKEIGTASKKINANKKEVPVETEKDFIDIIADKLLAKAMDKVNTKIGNSEDLFDDAVINSIVDKLFEKVSDQLNKKLGL